MEIASMLGYSNTFRERILEALEQLPPEDWRREGVCGWGALRDLVLHIVQSESFWIRGVIEEQETSPLEPEQFPEVRELRTRWDEIRQETIRICQSLTPGQLGEARRVDWEGQTFTFTVKLACWHFFMHEVHHRGQLCLLLRQLGHQPPRVDMI